MSAEEVVELKKNVVVEEPPKEEEKGLSSETYVSSKELELMAV
jgi:hypothetical protein